MITIAAYLAHCHSAAMNHRIQQLWINTPSYLHRLTGNATMQKHAPSALNGIMIVAFCWLLAYWTWVFVTPSPKPALDQTHLTANSVTLDPIVSAHLFGVSEQKAGASAVVQLSALGLKLHGVFAGEGKKGVFAIINIDQKDQSFRLGEEVIAGVVLTHVHPNYVELSYQGKVERLNLEGAAQADGKIILAPPILRSTLPENIATRQRTAQGFFP